VPDEVEAIHKAYMQTVDGETGSRDTLIGIANRLDVDAVVLAGTDLALIFNESNTPFPHVDCAKLHIEAIRKEIG
jgi:aspartate racemase